jgi:hypothetical protein
MDRLIERPAAPPERRRIAAARDLLERAEVLLPRDHPAAWRAHRATPDTADTAVHL